MNYFDIHHRSCPLWRADVPRIHIAKTIILRERGPFRVERTSGFGAKADVGVTAVRPGAAEQLKYRNDAQLYERWRRALRVRQSGADLKAPQAAAVKGRGGERCGNVGTRVRQARSREASASEPLRKFRKRI